MYSVTGVAGYKRNNHTAHGRTQFGDGRVTPEMTPFYFDCVTHSVSACFITLHPDARLAADQHCFPILLLL